MNGFTITDVSAFTGTPVKTLNWWIARGVFKPSIRGANGSGKGGILCNKHDLVAAGVAAALRRAGASHATAEHACRFIQGMEFVELVETVSSQPILFVGENEASLISSAQLADVMQQQPDVLRACSVFDMGRALKNLGKLFADHAEHSPHLSAEAKN